MKHHAASVLLLLGAAANSAVAALLLDFGPTSPTGSETNSPFHTATGSADTIWNVLGTADSSSLVNSDGSAATGLSLNLGAGNAAAPTLINLTNQPDTSSALGSTVNAGVYAGNSVGKDGIFEGTGLEVRSIGFQLSGLAAGTYDVYLTTRNTNTSAAYSMTSFAANGTAGNFDHAGYTSRVLTYLSGTAAATGAWVEEGNASENYTRFTVTLGAGEVLNVAVAGDGVQTRGFLNSAAIVAIPEPSSVTLLAFGLGTLCLGRRRR
jgi:hypothetical protein